MSSRPAVGRTNRKLWIVGLSLAAVLVVWYLFRPELLFINQRVNESLSSSSSQTNREPMTESVATGQFHSVAHDTKGVATIHQIGEGKRVLRLTNFETSNGPDVHLFLVAAGDAADSETVKSAGHIDLGKLKGNIGDQNYDLPGDVDLGKYRAVTVWCNRFGVNFGTAPLAMPGAMASNTDSANPTSISQGMFHGVAHDTKGKANVYRVDGHYVLRLTDFETSNGPDVRVYMVAANDAIDSDSVKSAGFVELGKLKGNIGDQNYQIPDDLDLQKYRAVTIWCARFGVNFGTAPLQ
jgi:hypothetical protein